MSADREAPVAIVSGPDEDDIATALEAEGQSVRRISDVATRPALESAGVHEASLFVLTDAADATAVPIVRDLTDEIRIVSYTRDSLPEFVSGQLDLAVDPQLLDAAIVADELTTTDD
ncbi:hypothetical protein C479_05268 [Halovivax asiaticus JCM 14624]|uniref:CTP synthetase n=1 Tax=Halovivax asiaticus JCM 14624 TaxID=1227490 RepID=M0BMS1_9EURY|nr:hypothetical protein [Halovivax asiaticus]ELZ12191.1 hypothetical protein C479_05268 [Halovivax asiaticus JCM 14624]